MTKLKIKWPLLSFIVLGIASTIWFLVRVIPKPQRATYPCMKAAAPFMSSFVIYLLTVTGAFFTFKKFRDKMSTAKYVSAFTFLLAAMVMFSFSEIVKNRKANAKDLVSANYFDANNPVGVPQGLFPGRVVWAWNPEATNANFEVKNNVNNWWANHTNGHVVEQMLNNAVKSYAGKSNVDDAWEAMFKYFNTKKEKGNIGYQPGEKIYIKINVTNSCCSVTGTKKTKDYDRMDSTPELMLALLKQLIEEVGVAQKDIYMGDPFRTFHDLYWNVCHSVYPDVNYVDGQGANGRYKTIPTSEHKMFFSDGKLAYRLPQEYYDAAYFINMPCLKSHDSGGITIGAKNHQGSILQDGAQPFAQSAYDMHYSLPDHDATDGGSHRYRHLVDYIGHEKLGGNTLLTIVDGIWAGRSWQGFVEKWQMHPFNGDYPNSILISQDPVAIDAVCYDFLLEEYKNKAEKDKHPYMSGTNDFLFQAADPAYWPEGITYDPEGDGTPLKSLGVYEHWNNPIDKAYSKNLGTGNGIELLAISDFPTIITTENTDLPNNNVNAIYVDVTNIAWLGTDNGLARFDGINTTIINTTNHLNNNMVNDIAYKNINGGNEIWVGTNNGLSALKLNDEGVASAQTYTPANSSLIGSNVSNVVIDDKNVIWAATNEALNVLSGTTWAAKTEVSDANGDMFLLSEFKITDMAEYTHDDNVFIATNGKGILRQGYNDVDGFTGASTMGKPWAALNTDEITAIATTNEIEQWFGTSDGVIFHPDNETKSNWQFYNKEESGLLDNYINAIHTDKNKNVWIGTNYGLNIIKNDGVIFEYDQIQGLVNNTINTIISDTKGNVWVGTQGGAQWFSEIPGTTVRNSANYLTRYGQYKAYPNPASTQINIDINNPNSKLVKISVYNMRGQQIGQVITRNTNVQSPTISIDVSDRAKYTPGIYIIKIDENLQTNILKAIIK